MARHRLPVAKTLAIAKEVCRGLSFFNLGTLGRNDNSATPMLDLFRGAIP